MDSSVMADAVALADQREPFTLATVVWRRGPTSGRVGAKVIIRTDGTVQGWLGGACAEPTVVRLAGEALVDGEPRLVFLGQPDELERRAQAGVVTVAMACESEGAMEVYLEPVLPRPQVVVIGRSPAVRTLAGLAAALSWDVVVIDDRGAAADYPDAGVVRTTLDLAGLGIGSSSAVVVATQGHYDDLALEAALSTAAGYVGLVASGKRAAATLSLLADRGVTDEQLARVVAPAGLDLGSVENAEIAVAVLAEVVARRAAGALGTAITVAEVRTERDPVCGMEVRPDDTRYHRRQDGRDFYFCAPGCQAAFDADPSAYAGV